MWLSFINAAHSARQVIRMLFDAVGGSAIYSKKNPFDCWLRDAETWCQHTVVQRKLLETIGGMLSSQTTNNHSRFVNFCSKLQRQIRALPRIGVGLTCANENPVSGYKKLLLCVANY